MQSMKAAVLREFKKNLLIEDIPIPEPTPDQVLVKMRACGLCATDLHIQDGMIPSVKLPLVPGHEMAGEIVEAGKNIKGLAPGAHVILSIDMPCGNCRPCRLGEENLCVNLMRLGFEKNGGFQEYIAVNPRNVHPISESIPFEKAAIVPDAVMCMYNAIKKRGKVQPGDRVLILGTGGLGVHGISVAHHFGAQVYVTSRQQSKIDFSLALGADGAINTSNSDLYEEIYRLTGGDMCDIVVDNIGLESTVQQCIDLSRPGGRVVVAGYVSPGFNVTYQKLVIKEREILGIRGGTSRDLQEVISLVEQGVIDPYVQKTFSLLEVNHGLELLREGKNAGRTALVFDSRRGDSN
jgi:2-desacetyl-2-hydroxyethyl bacteriochlorophyllide A dehydrogenase